MFSIRQNFTQRSSRLPRKRNLLGMDTVYRAQPYVDVVGKNANTLGLDVVSKAQPFVAVYDNFTKNFPFSPTGTNHPDVQMWQYLGGSANSSTITAMNNFCNSIDSAGLRSKFYRLNLFCGSDLTSCLIPLYTSNSWLSPNNGFVTDTNYNFVSNDYTETGASGGLLGNGSTKYLDTGISTYTAGLVGHISCYHRDALVTGTMMGVYDSNSYSVRFYSNMGINLIGGYIGTTTTTPWSSNIGGHYILNRTSASYMELRTNDTLTRGDSTVNFTSSLIPYTFTIVVFAQRSWYDVNNYISTSLQGYSIGQSLSSGEATSFYNAMQTFQTALGRNK